MYQTFVPNPESSFPNGVDTSCLTTNEYAINQRRAKRHIPDNQKDELYWERRKRNNIAAKKSRENKRKLDQMKLDMFAILEKENALLRKEICILKARYGIPTDICILTDEERENCLMINKVSMQDKSKAVDDVSKKEEIVDNNSPEHCRVDSTNGYNDSENSRNGKAELDVGQGVSVYTPFVGDALAIPSHLHSLQKYPSAHTGYFDAMQNAIFSGRQPPVAYQSRHVKPDSPCSTESSDSDLTYQEPFDLSINGSRRYEPNGRSVSQSSELNKYISPDLVCDQNRQLKNENDEIRKKLKQLSEQVSRMQQLIYTKQEH